jgi:hypothetical protein
MKACFIAAAALMLVPAAAAAQVSAADLNLALSQLERAANGLPRPVRSPRLVAAVNWLERRTAATNPSRVSREYVRSLRLAADLLTEQPTREVVNDVTAELEAKVEHCRVLRIGMGGSVLLRVSTRRGPQTVGDWQVLYLLKIYERASAASPATFPSLSSPTETTVEPGRYWLWARDPATGRTGARTLVRVAGQTELKVDLPVP